MPSLNAPAPSWMITQWFNTPAPLTLEKLRGKAVALYAFQMLCPGCVSHALPQAQRDTDREQGVETIPCGYREERSRIFGRPGPNLVPNRCRTPDDRGHIPLHQLVAYRLRQHRAQRRVDDLHRPHGQT